MMRAPSSLSALWSSAISATTSSSSSSAARPLRSLVTRDRLPIVPLSFATPSHIPSGIRTLHATTSTEKPGGSRFASKGGSGSGSRTSSFARGRASGGGSGGGGGGGGTSPRSAGGRLANLGELKSAPGARTIRPAYRDRNGDGERAPRSREGSSSYGRKGSYGGSEKSKWSSRGESARDARRNAQPSRTWSAERGVIGGASGFRHEISSSSDAPRRPWSTERGSYGGAARDGGPSRFSSSSDRQGQQQLHMRPARATAFGARSRLPSHLAPEAPFVDPSTFAHGAGSKVARGGSGGVKLSVSSPPPTPSSAGQPKGKSAPPAAPLDPRVVYFDEALPLRAGMRQLAVEQLERQRAATSDLASSAAELKRLAKRRAFKLTPVQSLAVQHFLLPSASASGKEKKKQEGEDARAGGGGGSFLLPHARSGEPTETVLAAETGSGKTWAFLFPLLQRLKETEGHSAPQAADQAAAPSVESPEAAAGAEGEPPKEAELSLVKPRALVVAPTHELARQLTAAAKQLTHIDKLRTLCLSSGGWLEALQADIGRMQGGASYSYAPRRRSSTEEEEQGGEIDDGFGGLSVPEGSTSSSGADAVRPVDLMISTPDRLLDLCKPQAQRQSELRADPDFIASLPMHKQLDPEMLEEEVKRAAARKPQLVSLAEVRAIVLDESDAMLARDFGPSTQALLRLADESRKAAAGAPRPDLLFATASVSHALASYMKQRHPRAAWLISPNLHRLPRTLDTQYVDPGRSRHETLANNVANALREDASAQSKILVFVEKKKTVEILGAYLSDRGIENVALTGESKTRSMRTNSHLAGFLTSSVAGKDKPAAAAESSASEATAEPASTAAADESPRVLISTSLLARGLDFTPRVSHIFLPDSGSASNAAAGGKAKRGSMSPLELLHRAGRGARAGSKATLVLFDKDATPEGRRLLRNKSGKTAGRVIGRVERLIRPLQAERTQTKYPRASLR